MKICYLNHDLENNTGAGRFCSALLKAVLNVCPNLDIEVLTSEANGKRQEQLYRETSILYPDRIKLFLNLWEIRSIFKECDIIHALDGWPYGAIAAVASFGLRKRIIITAIGTGAVKPLYHPIKFRILRWAYRRADILTAVSSNTKKEILKKIPDLKIEVINHGVEYDKFKICPFGTSPEERQNLKINELKPYILSVGTDKPRKGFEYSIRAFAGIREKFPGLKYVVVGDIRRKELIDLIKSLHLEDDIVMLKNLEEADLASIYRNAELFILLPVDDKKDIEAFGLVFLEAAASGCPAIGTFETGAEDAILDGKTGILVPQRDSNSAVNCAIKILSDNDFRNKLSRSSIEFAKSMTWMNIAKLYKSAYLK